MNTPRPSPAQHTNPPTAQDVELALAAAGLPRLAPQELEQLALYLGLLMKWNKAMNLVGVRDWRSALVSLGADSFFLADFLDGLPLPPEPEIWDLGAGAGLPGIPLRIIRRQGIYHMIEARAKRALFVGNVLAQLKLPGVFVHEARVEAFFQRPPGANKAQAIISRAFKPWREVLDLVRPHLAPQGLVVIMSNGREKKIVPEGWQNAGHLAYELPGASRMFQAFKVDSP